jgi:hypothetical protein
VEKPIKGKMSGSKKNAAGIQNRSARKRTKSPICDMMDEIKPPMRHIKWAEDAKGAANKERVGFSKKKDLHFIVTVPATVTVTSLSTATFDNRWLRSGLMLMVRKALDAVKVGTDTKRSWAAQWETPKA